MRDWRCLIGLHEWSKLGHTLWLEPPASPTEQWGVALEFRGCHRKGCKATTDMTTFPSLADEYHGQPIAYGPLAGQRFEEIMSEPRKPLPAPPIPIDEE